MKKLFGMAVLALGLVLAGAPAVMAGGSSDTSGEGFHCYGFFTLPADPGAERFAQVMVNDDVADVVIDKFLEFREKYEVDEGGVLTAVVGNVLNCEGQGETEGACCIIGGCVDDQTAEDCEALAQGDFQGPGTSCEQVACPVE